MDQPPMVIERVIDVRPGTILSIVVDGQVTSAILLPEGPARIAVEYFVRPNGAKLKDRLRQK